MADEEILSKQVIHKWRVYLLQIFSRYLISVSASRIVVWGMFEAESEPETIRVLSENNIQLFSF